uniref:Uncharacterized protein n=1 Tax=Leersia perrieri TaxID=77586 RepID=A0A0D9UWF2_9ORYZ
MEEDKHHAAVDLSEEEHGGGGDPGVVISDEVVGEEALTEEEGSSAAVDNAGHGAASEVAKNDGLEQPSPESEGITAVAGGCGGSDGDDSGGPMDEHLEVPKNPMANRFAFEATDANAITYRRMLSRRRRNSGPTRFVAAGDSAEESPEEASAMADADNGDSRGREKKKDLELVEQQGEDRVVSGHLAANAIPPSTFRIRPTRSRKQSSPTRFIVREATPPLPPIDSAPAAASSSRRDSSRSRKKRRPERFIPEEGEVVARAKARRSGIALDGFITSQINSQSESMNEWERDVTAADVSAGGVGGQRERRDGITGDRACCCSITVSDEPGETAEPADDSRTIYSILAVLGASLALTMLACVLFYVIGMEPPPSDQKQEA